MNNSNMVIPIFPLPVFLLPGGLTRLRVFETRYLKMVTIAAKEQGFVITLSTTKNNSLEGAWGSWVNIINFHQSDEGILEIDVQCHSLVKISATYQDSSKLNFGTMSPMTHWSQHNTPSSAYDLSQVLASVFNNNALLKALYTEKHLNCEYWVIARWVELLPVDLSVKSKFVNEYTFERAKSFVESIIMKQSLSDLSHLVSESK